MWWKSTRGGDLLAEAEMTVGMPDGGFSPLVAQTDNGKDAASPK